MKRIQIPIREDTDLPVTNDLYLPAKVELIIGKLKDEGYDAYAVGGCVRDSILGREPEDWDITTSALPAEVKRIFHRTLDTGLQHGTVTVMMGKEGYEVTTYRIDGIYEDGRHPNGVRFTPDLEQDLRRRDFTINAMAYNDEKGIVDVYGGMADLKLGIIRCVGNASERFTEDALRMLRAVRFSAQLGFAIEADTKAAIGKMAGNLSRISKERIQTELTKLLLSPHPDYFRQAYETGITNVIMPMFDEMMRVPQNNESHCFGVGEHTLKMLSYIAADKVLRWTALLHDSGKILTRQISADGCDYFPDHSIESERLAVKILKELKMDNDTIRQVSILIRYHAYPFKMNKYSVKQVLSQIGPDLFEMLLKVMEADTMAKSEYRMQTHLPLIREVKILFEEILANGECYSLKSLAVDGKDLINAGIPAGQEMGIELKRLLQIVLKQPELNKKEFLLQLLKK